MASYGKTGVLIVNLGTPDSPGRYDVYRYLREFLTDRRVIDYPWVARQALVQGIIAPFRSGSSAKLYQELWTPEGSPLKVYGENLVEALQPLLGDDCIVRLAMRYQSPGIEETIKELIAEDIDKLVVFSLFPQYASATVGSVHDEVMRVLREEENIPELILIRDYYDNADMVTCFADNARQFPLEDYDHVLFSFHGLPERQLRKADRNNHCTKVEGCCNSIGKHNQYCYSAQSHHTAQLIASELGLSPKQYTVCFQSRLGPEQWAKPYTSDIIKQRRELGDTKLLVLCPAFTADCLETVIEISDEYKEEFEELGGEVLDLVPSLNDDPKWVEAVARIIRERAGVGAMQGELG
jgi:ferrochelatase